MVQTDEDNKAENAVALLWEHFGPTHFDRIHALARAGHSVVAIELFAKSQVYNWDADRSGNRIRHVTLAAGASEIRSFRLAVRIVKAVRDAGANVAFFSHYSDPAVFLAALVLRLAGVRVITMLDSKEDDRKRSPMNGALRRLMMMPYWGGMVAGRRSRAYAQSLGIPGRRIGEDYNTLDIKALRALAAERPDLPFASRPFLIVARLVPKKNIATALRAYAKYRAAGGLRRLEIAGEGPEESKLRELSVGLGIDSSITWHGNLDRKGLAEAMRGSLALILPSTVEQFGFVVIEALAQGLVPIVTERAGAVDLLVDHRKNGVIIDPESEEDLLGAMHLLDQDEELWGRYSAAAYAKADRADCRHFAQSATRLIEMEGR